jgi:hypothetical protein
MVPSGIQYAGVNVTLLNHSGTDKEVYGTAYETDMDPPGSMKIKSQAFRGAGTEKLTIPCMQVRVCMNLRIGIV